tara:strand:+ start:42 stop:218 length:177 start_codon:yes stop_codon:yes gene_type:complete
MRINVLTNVKSKQIPDRRGVIVERKQKGEKFFYRILWDDNWDTGNAVFYEQKDFEILS